MSVIINRSSVIDEIRKRNPKIRKPENQADVLIIGKELYALDLANSKKRREFVAKGVKSGSIDTAFKYGFLQKKKAPRIRLLIYKRRKISAYDDIELRAALNYERKGMNEHLLSSTSARRTAAIALNLQSDSYNAIRNAMRSSTVQEEVNLYDKVFTELVNRKTYNKNYDYIFLGFRYLADKYWLSSAAQDILRKSR